nr:hypothetical protein [Pseudomonas sp.]
MTRPLIFAIGCALCAPAVFAQTPKPEVVANLNGLDIEVSAMGVPTDNTAAGGELVGIRAIRVSNRTGETVTCEFQVPDDARSDTSAPPVFTVPPNSQRVERVPGEYSADEPFAELSCRSPSQRDETPSAETPDESDADAETLPDPAPAAPEGDSTRTRDSSNRER